MIHRTEVIVPALVVAVMIMAGVVVATVRLEATPGYAANAQQNAEIDAADFMLARGETEFRDLACFLRPSGLYTCRAFTDGYPVFLRCYARAHTWEPVSGARCRMQP